MVVYGVSVSSAAVKHVSSPEGSIRGGVTSANRANKRMRWCTLGNVVWGINAQNVLLFFYHIFDRETN